MKTATRCVRPESNGDPFGAISPPIYQTATFRQESVDEFGEYDYTRSGNPTRSLVERQIADLEGGKHASAFASGMAAIAALTRLVSTGEEILCGSDLYGGTIRLLDQVVQRFGIGVKYVDTSDLDSVKNAITPQTKLLLLESPTNPLLRISDIEAIASLTRDSDVLFAVDNSMLSPCLQRPLALGADLVVHSATKFLCGHSDVTGGAVVTNDPQLHAQIAFHQNAEGAGLAPFESWLLHRGIKTLDLRVERQNNSALTIAKFLTGQRIVKNVYYPGLATHPGFEIHARQATGGGAVISFTTGDPSISKRIVESCTLFDIAVSFGSVGSVISMPCTMSHASVPAALREKLAPPSDLIRISVGIEAVEDLIANLENALENTEPLSAVAASASSRI
ncbi:MAG: cystathionine beta-lyase [Acidobacteria bacterium]|nr:MAG: cystathionine beta-lyase [Acidobacteriota bacterium]